MQKMMDNFFNHQKGMRRTTLLLMVLVAVVASYMVFIVYPDTVSTPLATCYAALIAATFGNYYSYATGRSDDEISKE